MSHIVSIQTQVRDPVAIRAACGRLGLPEPIHGKAKLFNDSATGWIVRLPGWRYPAVFDVASSHAHYDTFEGRWGDPRELDRFIQAYAVEAAKLQARKKGHTVTEQALADGSIKLTVQVGGAA
jgi:hypothetical protein